MSEVQLPEGWIWKKLGKSVTINPKLSRKDIPTELQVSFLPMRMVEEVTGRFNLAETRQYGEVKKGFTAFQDEDIIFAKVTPCMENGKIAVVSGLKNKIGFGSTEFHVFRCQQDLDNKYLFYFLVQRRFRHEAEGSMTGAVGLRRVPKSFLEEYLIPVPPLPVQYQIVARIEELFSELDAGVNELKTALYRLKTYRQAVLQNQLSNKNWPTIQLDGLLQLGRNSIKTGPFGMALSKSDHRAEGVPVLGIENIGRGKFWDRNKIFITADKAAELSSYTVSEGDLIISRSGTVGEICIVPPKMEGSIISTNLIKLSLNKNVVDPQYFCYLFLGCRSVLNSVKDQCKGSTRDFLNQGILKSLDFPLPDLHFQKQIVSEIEARLSEAEAMETTIRQELVRAENLRQSILKQAFEGKLVPSTMYPSLQSEVAKVAEPDLSNYGGKADQLTLF
ncbi:restriction endonuclease subunit S [Fibrella forsythiae]|uniref:Restriction endonuclease subunit S n=1 Tax=Fibrella forsythiae TaxID=2817061 RepID=A0ABS3JPU4_9BACT|nr:restriction endonuclease subunit S [Fibrella forsythiae]MBO0952016.1 restriction endonuclease subunit S [Fibrella forsythiae]